MQISVCTQMFATSCWLSSAGIRICTCIQLFMLTCALITIYIFICLVQITINSGFPFAVCAKMSTFSYLGSWIQLFMLIYALLNICTYLLPLTYQAVTVCTQKFILSYLHSAVLLICLNLAVCAYLFALVSFFFIKHLLLPASRVTVCTCLFLFFVLNCALVTFCQ